MNDVVVITTFQREELLYLSLEAIRKQDRQIEIQVSSDRNSRSRDLEKACGDFGARLSFSGSPFYGNSFNTISSLRVAQNFADIVHSIEDDTIIHPGYLGWAREQLSLRRDPSAGSLPVYAAVCGRIGSPHITNWYESPCASWNSECLRIAINHAIPDYFSSSREEMQKVLDEKMFPDSKYKKGGAEQDGFFLRCIEYHNWCTRFPPKPLATHLGWWGYNSPPLRERPKGTFEERIEQCRAMLRDVQQRRFLFGHRITDAEISGMNGL